MRVVALFYAGFRDAFGTGRLEVECEAGQNAQGLLEQLESARDARAAGNIATRFAINDEFVEPHTPLKEGDEVLFLPPVSGG